jgi:ethanolamine ammonia-lyase large subunit
MDPRELKSLFALANAFKEGDLLVGGTMDDRVREEARRVLSDVRLDTIWRTTLVEDGISAALERSRERQHDSELRVLTVGRVKRALLASDGAAWAARYAGALGSEAIAAAVKVMSDDQLSTVARTLFNPVAGPSSADGARDGGGERNGGRGRNGGSRGRGSRADRGGGHSGGNGGQVVIGSPGHFGSRIQPNSPGDDETEILFSILEGLAYGCGDVIIGLNPASDDLETIIRLEQLLDRVVERLGLPTRFCVLSDIVKQQRAQANTRIDVAFQSLAGTSAALGGMVGLDADGLVDVASSFGALYFETGQGSEVTNGAAAGVDMVTLESRTYGLARHVRQQIGTRNGGALPWTIVNDVAGFIGPEVFRSAAQLERACLEDVVMAKLHGLTMGLDVCATFHMGIAPMELRDLTRRITERAAPSYLMAVAGNADPMLGYLTTSFREHPELRGSTGKRMASAMERRLHALGVAETNATQWAMGRALRETSDAGGTSSAIGAPRGPTVRAEIETPALGLGETRPPMARVPDDRSQGVARLYAAYAKATGDRRAADTLHSDARRIVNELRERGFDLGVADASAADRRLERIYAHARRALYATLDDGVIGDGCVGALRLRTTASDRDDYIAHPSAGERLRVEDAAVLARLHPTRAPQIQLVVSDGLNADAINEHLRSLLPQLRRLLLDGGCEVSASDLVITNGRVRVGYEIGGLVRALVVVHVIGERPGTGLNTASAYVTYGRDETGASRWSPTLDHSATTAICGIHPQGKPTDVAAAEIARTVGRILAQQRSGVALRA